MGVTAGAPVRVALGGVVEAEPELMGERGDPGDDVAEFVQLLVRGALPSSLGEFAHLLAEPRDRGCDATIAVSFAVRRGDAGLEVADVHGGPP